MRLSSRMKKVKSGEMAEPRSGGGTEPAAVSRWMRRVSTLLQYFHTFYIFHTFSTMFPHFFSNFHNLLAYWPICWQIRLLFWNIIVIVGHVGGCWSWLINDARMELKLKITYILHNISCICIILYIHCCTCWGLVNQCQNGAQTEDTHTWGNSMETLLWVSVIVRLNLGSIQRKSIYDTCISYLR